MREAEHELINDPINSHGSASQIQRGIVWVVEDEMKPVELKIIFDIRLIGVHQYLSNSISFLRPFLERWRVQSFFMTG
ncbi:MAG: hypothetical protein Q9165_004253 [Trypethelium subeluteriae]